MVFKYPYRSALLLAAMAFFCTLHGFAQYQQLVHKTHAERSVLLSSFHDYKAINPNYDSATFFNEVAGMRKAAVDGNDIGLEMDCDMSLMAFFVYRPKYSDSIALASLQHTLHLAQQRKLLWAEAGIEKNFGSFYFYRVKNYEKAFEHYDRLYYLLNQLDAKAFIDKVWGLRVIGEADYYFGDYPQAIFFMQESNKAAVYRTDPLPYLASNFNLMGLCYRQLHKMDSSLYCFTQALQKATQDKDSQSIAQCSTNLGEHFFLLKQYERALPYLQTAIAYNASMLHPERSANTYLVLGLIDVEIKNIGALPQAIADARRYVYLLNDDLLKQKLYLLLTKYYALAGNSSLSFVYLDSVIYQKDTITRRFNALQMLRAAQKIDEERNKAVVDAINNEKKIKTLQRDGLVAAIVLMMAIATLVYYNIQRRNRLKLRDAEKELAFAEFRLREFTKNIAEKNNLIEKLKEQAGSEQHNIILQIQQSTILTDEEWAEFRQLFEKVHPGYLQRLKEKLPLLTPAETRFIVLSKLKISAKEMAAMLGVGANAIRQYRIRLRKKLNLPEEDSLEPIIDGI